ncbi:MAG: hypothetical protein JKY20_12415 [Alphaproteobacteria bacterium]|nr:hypothetical protein [Alphaproteobacteria bacterium]
MIDIPELTFDALTELVSLSINRSANALNEMIGHEITLSVPKVEIMEFEMAQTNLRDRIDGDMATICQDFNGPIEGKSFLILPAKNSLELITLILGDDVPAEEILDYEEETLVEVGNILLNAFLGSLSNELRVTISSEIPTFSKLDFNEHFGDEDIRKHTVIMFVHVDFVVEDVQIPGYLILVINVIALQSFIFLIDKYIERMS